MRERTRELLARLHLPLSPDQRMERLSAAHRQLVQVARALAFDCRLLVLDEPTTALTGAETDHLFRILEDLRGRGVTLLYVSHRLPEVFRLCERITVLRDGQHVGTFPRSETTPDQIIRAMVGRDLGHAPAASPEAAGASVLRLSGYTRRPCFEEVCFSVGSGEVVGLFGLVGAGRSELLETIFGIYSPDRGTVELDGRPLRAASPRQAARAGIALAPEERQRQGLFFNLGLRANLVLPAEAVRGRARIRPLQERREAAALVEQWGIRARGLEAAPDTLSGGNQQKVVLAKWLATRPRLLMLDEPTKGVDVGAKYDIHQIVRRHAASGAACLVASSDLPEVLSLCHRIVVMREGRVQGEVSAGAATEESVMRLATGERAMVERAIGEGLSPAEAASC
jgi:rhamnose transport system ATP-binding protein